MLTTTQLEPVQQWRRTLAIAGDADLWLDPAPPPPPTGHKAIDQFNARLARHTHNRWPSHLWLGIAAGGDRHFQPGDVMLVVPSNGQGERYPVWSYTSRNHDLHSYFVNFYKYKEFDPAAPLAAYGTRRHALLQPSDDVVGRRLDDPAVEDWILAERARFAACRGKRD